MILTCLYLASTNERGRGIFTRRDILAGTVIEISPVIVMGPEDRRLIDQTLLHDYIFEWNQLRKQCCMALGYVAIYNHSYQSNCEYEMDYEKALVSIKSIRFIREGEELFINYNGDWNNEKPVWFDVQ